MIQMGNGDVNTTAAAGNAGLVTRFPIVISMVIGTSVYFTRQSQKRVKKNRQTNWLNSQRQSELVTGINVFLGHWHGHELGVFKEFSLISATLRQI